MTDDTQKNEEELRVAFQKYGRHQLYSALGGVGCLALFFGSAVAMDTTDNALFGLSAFVGLIGIIVMAMFFKNGFIQQDDVREEAEAIGLSLS